MRRSIQSAGRLSAAAVQAENTSLEFPSLDLPKCSGGMLAAAQALTSPRFHHSTSIHYLQVDGDSADHTTTLIQLHEINHTLGAWCQLLRYEKS